MKNRIQTWHEAMEFIGERDSRKIDNNTYLVRGYADTLAVRLHNTEVVTYFPDGRIMLNTGGYETTTTKRRMNSYSSAYVYQKDCEWYVVHKGITKLFNGPTHWLLPKESDAIK